MQRSKAITTQDHSFFMQQALDLAQKALALNEVPVGALIINPHGEVIGQGYNRRETQNLATCHAELMAIEEANKNLKSWRLEDCVMYVTLEPCPMCAGALWACRIKHVIFGATDPKSGFLHTLYQLGEDQRLNHQFEVTSGILQTECSELLKSFFKKLRQKEKP